jgi:DNA-binding NarL/FixJ family response regulator
MIKILIVDDQKTVQEVLLSYLQGESGLDVLGVASDGQMALDLIEQLKPDIVLMDIEMPALDGLTATRIITERFVETKVVILTVHDDDTYLNSALQVGAKGYLMKNTPAKELINAIYSAYKGYFQLGPGLLEKYLYKIGSSSSNITEVTQLKQMMEKQAELLEQMQDKQVYKGSYRQPKVNQDDSQRKFNSLEKQLYSLQYRIDKITKRLELIQNFCFFLTLAFAIVFFVSLLLNL